MIDTIRLDELTKKYLTILKRRTGISQWNILSRWAFIISLMSRGKKLNARPSSNSNIEMSWKIFSGRNDKIYSALLAQAYRIHFETGFRMSETELLRQLVQNGAALLVSQKDLITDISGLVRLATSNEQ